MDISALTRTEFRCCITPFLTGKAGSRPDDTLEWTRHLQRVIPNCLQSLKSRKDEQDIRMEMEGTKPREDTLIPRTVPRFKFQEKSETTDMPGCGARGREPEVTAVSTSAGLFIRKEANDSWNLITNGSVDN